MSVGAAESDEEEVMAAINTTPLVDVMLVLLIIFLITVPVVAHTIPLQLPKEATHPFQTKPANVNIAITKDGEIYWNKQFVPDHTALLEKLKTIAVLTPQPEIEIRGDHNVRYEFIGKVVLACQRAGIVKVGFVIEPPAHGG
jgi:biopolymer transport protein ExbD